MFKKFIYFFLAAAVTTSSVFTSVSGQDFGFSDVHVGLRSYVPIKFFIEHALISGYEDKTFRPDDSITRAESVTFAQKAIMDFNENTMDFIIESSVKSSTESSTESSAKFPKKQTFKDVPMNHFAAAAIENAFEKKIISGYKKNLFKPDKPIKLVEGIKILLEFEHYSEKPEALRSAIINTRKVSIDYTSSAGQNHEELKNLFMDVKDDEWFAPYVKEAKDRGMLRFGMKNRIEPEQILTRGYFTDLAYRLIKSRDPNRFFGKATFYSDFFEGRGTANGEKFTQNGYTAAHKTLPFGTRVRVTNLKNGQHVDVRINDRGPFPVSLDLDLTSKAFSEIAANSEGIVPAQYEILPQ